MKKTTIISARIITLCLIAFLISCTITQDRESLSYNGSDQVNDFSVLVMAHGGSTAWSESVEDSLDQLRSLYPVEIAFGMANAGSLEASVRKLESQGARHVGVVRLFVSGESWYHRTLQILGVEEGAPAKNEESQRAGNSRMSMGFWKIETDLAFHVSEEGLAEAEEMDEVLLSRVSGMSSNPSSEVVAVIAHGPADDDENTRWIAKIGERTELLKRELKVSDIKVFTLREDWEEKRADAEEQIRDFVQHANVSGLDSIIVPFRVQGFGPYADVLDGLNYRADQLGLVPHENVALWIKNQAEELREKAVEHRHQLAQMNTR